MNKKIIAAVMGLAFLTFAEDWFLKFQQPVYRNHRRMRSRHRITDILTIISRK